MRLTCCRFLVPVEYNDGRPVEPEIFIEIKSTLDRQFGGYRVKSQQEGSWKGQVENTIEMEVSVLPNRIDELRNVVVEIGKKLGQKAMYFDAPEPSVEIIEIDEEENKSIEKIKQSKRKRKKRGKQ